MIQPSIWDGFYMLWPPIGWHLWAEWLLLSSALPRSLLAGYYAVLCWETWRSKKTNAWFVCKDTLMGRYWRFQHVSNHSKLNLVNGPGPGQIGRVSRLPSFYLMKGLCRMCGSTSNMEVSKRITSSLGLSTPPYLRQSSKGMAASSSFLGSCYEQLGVVTVPPCVTLSLTSRLEPSRNQGKSPQGNSVGIWDSVHALKILLLVCLL